MKRAYKHAARTGSDWRAALATGLEYGLPSLFNIETLIDHAERKDWSVKWW